MKISELKKLIREEIKSLLKEGYITEGLTPEQKKGLFIIGSDTAKDRYQYDEESLVEDMEDNGLVESDYEFIIARGDDFPNMIKIKPQSLSRILANQEMVNFLQDIEGDGQY